MNDLDAEQKERARRRVEAMRVSLDELDVQRDRLLARRNQLFAKLRAEGVPQSELARWYGITQQAVAFAVQKATDAA